MKFNTAAYKKMYEVAGESERAGRRVHKDPWIWRFLLRTINSDTTEAKEVDRADGYLWERVREGVQRTEIKDEYKINEE